MTSAGIAAITEYPSERNRTGWKNDEENLLFNAVKTAREQGRSLKSVFDYVAQQTGRKPNSIRNYYYAKAKENPEHDHSPAFVPFTQEEMWDLLTSVLGAQAKGQSVRACTLKLGGGDTKAMLRYQNKYRAMIKNNPVFVKEVVRYMRENDMPTIDPYERISKLPKKTTREDGYSGYALLVRLTDEVEELKRRTQELEIAMAEFSAM